MCHAFHLFFQNSFSTYNPNFNHNNACFICQSLHNTLVRMHSLKIHMTMLYNFFFSCIAYFKKCFFSCSACKHFNDSLYLFYLWPLQQFIYNCVLLHCILRTMHYIFFFQMSNLYLPISLNSIKFMIATHS